MDFLLLVVLGGFFKILLKLRLWRKHRRIVRDGNFTCGMNV